MISYFPRDFASRVRKRLLAKRTKCPTHEDLTSLFELMYFASLEREESQKVRFNVVYIDPSNPDPNPPPLPPEDRWSYIRFSEPIKVAVSSFVKLCKATDVRSTSMAVYMSPLGGFDIWGLIDQQSQFHDYINHNADSGPERPGIFQVSVAGTGHLVAYLDYEKLAELKANRLTETPVDALAYGFVAEKLNIGIDKFLVGVKKQISPTMYEERDHWDSSLRSDWIAVIRMDFPRFSRQV